MHAPICTLHVYMYLIFNANTCNYCILIVKEIIRTYVKYYRLGVVSTCSIMHLMYILIIPTAFRRLRI